MTGQTTITHPKDINSGMLGIIKKDKTAFVDSEGNTEVVTSKKQEVSEEPEVGKLKESATQPENITTEPKKEAQAESKDNHNWEKRYGDMKSKYDIELPAKDKEIAELQKQLQTAKYDNVKLPSTPEEVEAFKKQMPDFYNVMQTEIIKGLRDHDKELAESNKENEKKVNELTQSVSQLAALYQLQQHHPDILQIKDDQKFWDWVDSQKSYVKKMVESDDIEEVAEAVTRYKKDVGITKSASKKKAEEAKEASKMVDVSARSGPTVTEGKIIKESDTVSMYQAYNKGRISLQEMNAFEEEVKKARAEGRFDYNITFR